MSEALNRIGIVMVSAVGDTVHVLPIVNALKRANPAAHITWVLQPLPATLVRGHAAVDDIVAFDRWKGIKGIIDVTRELRARRFDLLINLQVYLKAGLITAFSGAGRRLGFDRSRARDVNWLFTTDRIPPHPVQHVQDQYFEFLDVLGIPREPVVWNLGPWDSERAWQRDFVSRIGRPMASIVVGTSNPEKDWMPDRWAAICDVLYHDFGLQPVLVGGNSEQERTAAAAILQLARAKPVSELGSGLRNLVGIVDASELVLAPDTGPLHMAVALNRPVISLMGYSDPRRTGPYRKFQELIVDAYHDPGEARPVTMQTRAGRMSRISVADVTDRIAVWDSLYRPKS